MTERRKKSRVRRKKEAAGGKEPGDLIPMPDHQREFLKVHDRFVKNPEMELIMAMDPPSNRSKMSFGTNPLPWERPMNAQDFRHLKQAQDKTYVCKNKDCQACDQEATANYYVVTFKREIPHSDTGNSTADQYKNAINLKRFGKREQIYIHCGVQCKRCKQHIQYVKYSLSHRRAAKDPLVSGPHQRYGIKPTYS